MRADCFNNGLNAGITVMKQLDEPQKPVVDSFVAEWFEDNKDTLDLAIFMAIRELDDEEWPHKTDFENWLDVAENKPIETLIHMKDGYEVEKEPLYMVPLLTDKEGNKKILVERRGEYDIIWDYENEDDWHELLTEEQIKSVNPDYWKFAVLYEPSEEVLK
ncbi:MULTISPECIES: DUF1642 domain-containing protein [Enterococcus]|uniref:DUF1642 domain-containing protein n=1 Tax=Enterococcus TaxID=1350 RepID=UPI001E410744|nr:DUF1642 domain-containing protein [Enterococcus hirae]